MTVMTSTALYLDTRDSLPCEHTPGHPLIAGTDGDSDRVIQRVSLRGDRPV